MQNYLLFGFLVNVNRSNKKLNYENTKKKLTHFVFASFSSHHCCSAPILFCGVWGFGGRLYASVDRSDADRPPVVVAYSVAVADRHIRLYYLGWHMPAMDDPMRLFVEN